MSRMKYFILRILIYNYGNMVLVIGEGIAGTGRWSNFVDSWT